MTHSTKKGYSIHTADDTLYMPTYFVPNPENRLRPLEMTHLHPVLRIARRALVDRDNFVKHAQNAV